MQYITIANTPRPVNFGTAAIMKLEELTGIPFYEFLFSLFPDDETPGNEADESALLAKGLKVIQKAGVTEMVSILEAGMYGGALKSKTSPIPRDELIDLLDAEGDNMLPVLVQALGMAFSALPGPSTDTAAMPEQQKKRVAKAKARPR